MFSRQPSCTFLSEPYYRVWWSPSGCPPLQHVPTYSASAAGAVQLERRQIFESARCRAVLEGLDRSLRLTECYVCRTYLANQLLPHDQRHWKAAGILLYARGQDGSLQLLLGRIDMGARPAGAAKSFRRHEGWWILGEWTSHAHQSFEHLSHYW